MRVLQMLINYSVGPENPKYVGLRLGSSCQPLSTRGPQLAVTEENQTGEERKHFCLTGMTSKQSLDEIIASPA